MDHFYYQFAIIAFVVLIIIRIIWDSTITKRRNEKEKIHLARRMFQNGLHEGSNRYHYASRNDNSFIEMTFEEYLKQETND